MMHCLEMSRHWELSMRHIELMAVEVTNPGETARLRATVQESAKLLDQDGAVEETLDNAVVIQYELRWQAQPNPGWLISDFKEIS